MALTTIDPVTALIVVDLQNGLLGLPTAHPLDGVVARAAALAAAFRDLKLPVILVNVTGGAPGRTEQPRRTVPTSAGWSDFVPALQQRSDDHVVTKQTWGAFSGTDLADYLKAAGVTQVVIAGVATSAGVESTARQAHELGFHVTLVVDAMTDMNLDAHHNSVARIFPRLGETGTTQDVLDLLSKEQGPR
jgi:nicotinamidase-related amidase